MTSEHQDALLAQLKREMSAVVKAEIGPLVREAKDEARAEARAILKRIMLEAMLESALQSGRGVSDGPSTTGCPVAAPPDVPNRTSTQEDAEPPGDGAGESSASRVTEAGVRHSQPSEQYATLMIEPGSGQAADAVALVSAPPQDAGFAFYVYAVVARMNGDSAPPLASHGIDPAHPVYALTYEDMEAILSRVSLGEFGEDSLRQHVEDVVWLESKVRAHQSIVESLMNGRGLVPFKFCTIYRTEDRVCEMLALHHKGLQAALGRLEGKSEWGVKLFCNRDELVATVGQANERIRSLRDEIASKPSGAAYLLRKRLDQETAAEADRVADEVTTRSHELLSHRADDAVVNALQGREATGRADDMVLNAAYLVENSRSDDFRQELETLAKTYGSMGFAYELTGPWPAYNFSTIERPEDSDDETAV